MVGRLPEPTKAVRDGDHDLEVLTGRELRPKLRPNYPGLGPQPPAQAGTAKSNSVDKSILVGIGRDCLVGEQRFTKPLVERRD
jgi:hypothetical protein